MSDLCRALIVLNCGLSVPSAMVRALQYRPHFERSTSWRAGFVSRKSERLAHLVNRTRRPARPLVTNLIHRPVVAYTDRWERRREDEIIRQARDHDLVYAVKMPHLGLYQRLRELEGPKIVMDMNDGLWLPAFQAHEWKDLDAILTVSDAVICENEYVADYARKHNACVCVVPDSPQLEVFDHWRGRVQRNADNVVLGWVGGPENVGALYRILEPLEALFTRHANLRLRVVGVDSGSLPRFESVRWSCRSSYNQEQMVQEALAFDVGLFPLFHNGDGLARGTLKAMIYMSAGAAALCENYGENPKLIRDGVNGVLARSAEEWLQKLEWLVTHADERRAIARRGLETVRGKFNATAVFAQLTAAFDRILASDARPDSALPKVSAIA